MLHSPVTLGSVPPRQLTVLNVFHSICRQGQDWNPVTLFKKGHGPSGGAGSGARAGDEKQGYAANRVSAPASQLRKLEESTESFRCVPRLL
jgi:hypothetical protein